ncbi:MAG: hypothetical protein IJJ60_08145, partial [Clostridia bacterium]|nr:hypothetical protein [Clostridia bacterium]
MEKAALVHERFYTGFVHKFIHGHFRFFCSFLQSKPVLFPEGNKYFQTALRFSFRFPSAFPS